MDETKDTYRDNNGAPNRLNCAACNRQGQLHDIWTQYTRISDVVILLLARYVRRPDPPRIEKIMRLMNYPFEIHPHGTLLSEVAQQEQQDQEEAQEQEEERDDALILVGVVNHIGDTVYSGHCKKELAALLPAFSIKCVL